MANKKDFAVGLVDTAPSPALSGTSLGLQAGIGARMPAVPFFLTATPPGQMTTLDTSEKISVTNVTGDTLTIVRAQGDTTAKPIGVGWIVSNGIYTADVVDELDLKATQNPGICAETPIGASDISIDYTTRVLTITPPLGEFHYFTDGDGVVTKHVVTGPVSFPAFTDTSGIWNFYFDNDGVATVAQGNPPNFDTITMVYRLLWNATLSGAAKATVETLETHQNTVSGIDHTWKHKYGTIWVSGGDLVSNTLPSGTPNVDGRNAVIGLTTINNLDDNLPYTITNSTGGLAWQQDLGNTSAAALNATNSALFKVRLQDAGGLISYISATRFPFAYNVSNTPEYISTTGVRTNVTAGNYFVYFVYVIQDPRNGEALRSVSATTQYNTLTLAQAVAWSDIQSVYTTLNDGEIRPLYKLIYQYQSGYNVGTKKAALRETQDLRVARVTATTAAGSVLATSVINTPAGGIASTNVQDALNELDTEKVTANVAITGATKTKITYDAKGLVTAGADATTADIAASTDKNYMTDAQITALHPQVTGGTPAIVLGTANTAGNAATFIRTNDTILAFDATAPSTQAFGDSAAVGTATVAARRDHKHAMPAAPVIPVKATGAELDTATDDVKFATAKALKDSHNVPSVIPGTSGNVLVSNGTDWISSASAGNADTLDGFHADSFYPVGTIYSNKTNSANPSTYLPGQSGTTWTALAGVVVVGKAASGTFATIGATGGEETHTLTTTEMPYHNHGLGTNAQTHTSGSSYSHVAGVGSWNFGAMGANATDYAGSSGAHNNLQPYVVAYVWERVA